MNRIMSWSSALIALLVLSGCANAQPSTGVATAAALPSSAVVPPTLAVVAPTAAAAAPTAVVESTAVAAAPTAGLELPPSVNLPTTSTPIVQEPPYADRTDAVALLASFYNAVNRKDFQRAYSYLQNPTQTLDQLTLGYDSTAEAQLIVRPPTFYDASAGNVYTRIPALVLATSFDGSTQIFSGCYDMHRANIGADAGPQGNNWEINKASITQAPTNADAVALLSQPCDPSAPQQNAFDNRDSAADLLASYYNAISVKDYKRAYSYWEKPTQTSEQFAAGYANTANVLLFIRPPTQYDAGAGNVRTNVPALVVASQTDGSTQVFAGCYALHRANIGADAGPQGNAWGIESASLTQAPSATNAISLLPQSCTP